MTRETSIMHLNAHIRRRIAALLVMGAWLATGEPAEATDGIWTIRCGEFMGPRGLEVARHLAETLRKTPGIRANDVVVMQGADDTARLYYGRYRRRTDKKSQKRSMPKEMRRDMDLLRELVDATGRRYFMMAVPVRYPVPDVGNPDWALREARGVYTLQVAVFEPTDEFAEYKQAAADYCELLREKGYEAYYHHTEASSMVTVGVFGRDAVRFGVNGRHVYSHEVSQLQQEELLQHNLTNGAVIRVRNDAGDLVAVPSLLVKLPEPAAADQP